MATADAEPKADPFVELSLRTWKGLEGAVIKLERIADGRDPAATEADRNTAGLQKHEDERERVRIMERLTAYVDKQLQVNLPSDTDLERSKNIATDIAKWRTINVTVTTIVRTTTELLQIYNKA